MKKEEQAKVQAEAEEFLRSRWPDAPKLSANKLLQALIALFTIKKLRDHREE